MLENKIDGGIKTSQQSEEERTKTRGRYRNIICVAPRCVLSSTCLYVHHDIQTLDTQEATYADIAAWFALWGGGGWGDDETNIHQQQKKKKL